MTPKPITTTKVKPIILLVGIITRRTRVQTRLSGIPSVNAFSRQTSPSPLANISVVKGSQFAESKRFTRRSPKSQVRISTEREKFRKETATFEESRCRGRKHGSEGTEKMWEGNGISHRNCRAQTHRNQLLPMILPFFGTKGGKLTIRAFPTIRPFWYFQRSFCVWNCHRQK